MSRHSLIVGRTVVLFALLSSLLLSASIVHAQSKVLPAKEAGNEDSVLMVEPVAVYRMELTSEAPALWRRYASQKPALLLLSNDPMLTRVPAEVKGEVSRLVTKVSHEELLALSDYTRPSHLFLPGMTLDIVLRQDWFGELFWAYPAKDTSQSISLDALASQLDTAELVNETELSGLTVKDRAVHGLLRDVHATMAPLPNLGKIVGPVLVHIDQSYFQGLYDNEIATPLLQVVSETLIALRELNLKVLAVTYSVGNLDNRVSLRVRFLQEIVTAMIMDPSLLEPPWPLNWQRQQQILYLDNFFRKEETLKLAKEMEAENPASAWVKFALYLSAVEHKQGAEALTFLSEAVALDKVYALEYLNLSEMAYEKDRPDEAMRMLSLAAKSFPENIQIKLNMARLASDIGEIDTALHLVEQLQSYQWSPLYYTAMPEYLKGFAAFLKNAKGQTVKPDAVAPAGDSK